MNTNTGIESSTKDEINWRNLNEERIDDPIITALVKEAEILFIKNETIENTIFDNNIHIYIQSINDFLKKNKYKTKFSEMKVDNVINSKKKLSKKEVILQQLKDNKNKDEIDKLLNSFKMNNHLPYLIKKPIESY